MEALEESVLGTRGRLKISRLRQLNRAVNTELNLGDEHPAKTGGTAEPTTVLAVSPSPGGRRKRIDKADFEPFSTRMSAHLKDAVETELIRQRRAGKSQAFSELLDELLRDWLAARRTSRGQESACSS